MAEGGARGGPKVMGRYLQNHSRLILGWTQKNIFHTRAPNSNDSSINCSAEFQLFHPLQAIREPNKTKDDPICQEFSWQDHCKHGSVRNSACARPTILSTGLETLSKAPKGDYRPAKQLAQPTATSCPCSALAGTSGFCHRPLGTPSCLRRARGNQKRTTAKGKYSK